METKKERTKTSKNNGTSRKWTPTWKPGRVHLLVIWFLFSVRDGRPWEPKWLPRHSQESPRPIQASISIDFVLFLNDVLMIFLYSVGIFYLVFVLFLDDALMIFKRTAILGVPKHLQSENQKSQLNLFL